MKKRVLVVGGTGMLGHKLVELLGADPGLEVHCTVRELPPALRRMDGVRYHTGIGFDSGSESIARVLDEVAPEATINAVGAIKQKDLGSAMDETFYLNGSLPHLLALLNPNRDGGVIHFSTDCVFTGERGGYRESDPPDALDLYGRSKACGEIGYGNHLTLRTSIIGFELKGHLGLLSWLFSQPEGSTLRGFTQAIYSGLPTRTLSRIVLDLVKRDERLTGVFQVASEPIDKFDLLQRLNERFELGHTLVPDDSVRIDRSLDDTRFREATATGRPGWDELVAELEVDFVSQPYGEIYAARRARPVGTR